MKRILLSLLLVATIAPAVNAADAQKVYDFDNIPKEPGVILGVGGCIASLYLASKYTEKISETIKEYSDVIGYSLITLASIYCMSKGVERVISPEQGQLFLKSAGVTGGVMLVCISPFLLLAYGISG